MKWVLAVVLVAAFGIAVMFLGYYQGRQAYMTGYKDGYTIGYINAEKEHCGKR